jgi:predicted acylesterase/phospholipase RssA/CRP-like cAMP-binding protein
MDVHAVLSQTRLFSRIPEEAMNELAARAEIVEIKSGGTLFEVGGPSDGIYVVATGRLRVVLPNGIVAGEVVRYEPIGEIGLLSGEPRSATIYAVRDSILLKFDREELLKLAIAHPEALVEMTRVIVTRLRQNQRAKALEDTRNVHNYAIIPAGEGVDSLAFAKSFADALSIHDATLVVDEAFVDTQLGPGSAQKHFTDVEDNSRVTTLLNTIEDEHRYLVFASGPQAGAWARRCMRQADHVIVVAHTGAVPAANAMLDSLRTSGIRAPIDLVLLRPQGVSADDVFAWRECVGAAGHYFLRPQNADDWASLARQLTGRGVGLVLGGGGSRGFAHIGLVRALRELRIPVDLVGGSSMGAFLSALLASGYDHLEMTQIARDTFVKHNYLNDYMFPTIALIRGRKFVQRLHQVFEERQIEQLRTPYFCVSTNLTRGATMVHDRGPLYLWLAASMSVPGVAPPIVYKGELLADGAVINSLPTDVMQNLRRGPIIASDVSTEGYLSAPGIEGPDTEALTRWTGSGERPTLFSILFRTASITSESGVIARAARADLYLRMPVTGIGLFEWKKIDELIERGYRHALEKLAPVRDALLR